MPFSVPAGSALRRILFASVTVALIAGASALTPIARADTPAQTRQTIQAVCNRAAASYERRDASGFMAMHSPNFTARNVTGRKATLSQERAAIAKAMTRKGVYEAAQCLVSPVVFQGSRAAVVLHWRFTTHHARSSSVPAYTMVRAYDEQTTWEKVPQGWQEDSADMTRDVAEYKR